MRSPTREIKQNHIGKRTNTPEPRSTVSGSSGNRTRAGMDDRYASTDVGTSGKKTENGSNEPDTIVIDT